MKVLLIVLAIQMFIELISNKKSDNKKNDNSVINANTHHPAEYELR